MFRMGVVLTQHCFEILATLYEMSHVLYRLTHQQNVSIFSLKYNNLTICFHTNRPQVVPHRDCKVIDLLIVSNLLLLVACFLCGFHEVVMWLTF